MQAVMLLTSAREVSVLNLGRNIHQSDCEFSWFYWALPFMCRGSVLNCEMVTFLSYPFPFIIYYILSKI
jgi:hypothetical protein